ncbi:MAG: hypothetical protein MR568_08350 [Eisenbergiella massiliensis]|uniref:hypothetical protein n=1 Tax=Eisenbergiella massiliensis TaxID=1720294 RepID=UPI0023F2F2AD|nr:hypothetical protein [Eisenbergiella massiliensis]MCI6706971.1 hypothetical protein [Eisenbergiella massiliensis]
MDSVTGSVVEPVVVSSAVSELPPSTDVSTKFDRAVSVGATVAVTHGSTLTSFVGFSVAISSTTGVASASNAIADIGIAAIRQKQHSSKAISLWDNPSVFLLLLFIEIPPALSISTIQAHIFLLFIYGIPEKKKSSNNLITKQGLQPINYSSYSVPPHIIHIMSRLQNIHQSFAIGLGVFERTKSHPPNSFFKKQC